ncbi:MAG: dUTP pyrophosphatase [Minwuia thermotolerans]|nr:MAG: dUTP pyrophosphatase [Minwuia thermotolerans]
MFWGGGRLGSELEALISDYDPKRIDNASYRLRVGPEIYVSPTGEQGDPHNKPKTLLSDGEGFTIPAGQFGFILTEEQVRVPMTAIAFISIRAGYKFRGLVNVSGFHVDPNYEGRLIFSVFNAGPGPVHLSRGEPCFLIWYADLDQPTEVEKKAGFNSIPSHLTGPLAGGLQSFAGLLSKINENEKEISARVGKIEREQAVIRWASVLAIGALVTLGVRECSSSHPVASPIQAETNSKQPPPTLPKPSND